jgi:hypothetical protein
MADNPSPNGNMVSKGKFKFELDQEQLKKKLTELKT